MKFGQDPLGFKGMICLCFFLPTGKSVKEKKKQEAGSTNSCGTPPNTVRSFGARMACSYFEKICEAELEVELFFGQVDSTSTLDSKIFLKGNSGLLFTTQCLLEIVRSLSDI